MKKIFALAFIIATASSCSQVIIPNYTTIPEIYNLKKGMTMDKVNGALGVGPYEFYTNFYDGNKVLVYKYKKTYQVVPLNSQDNRENLSGGPERFKNEGNLYVVFDQKTDAMEYFITTSGRKLARKIVNESNQLKLVKADPILFRQYWSESTGLNSGYYKALNDAAKENEKSSQGKSDTKSFSSTSFPSGQAVKEMKPTSVETKPEEKKKTWQQPK